MPTIRYLSSSPPATIIAPALSSVGATRTRQSNQEEEDRKKGKPTQIKFVRSAQMSQFARVTCWPPLGQVTSLAGRKGSGGENAKRVGSFR